MQLRYLTSNDWALLRSKSRRVTYKPREIIIAINSRPSSLFMVVSGTAAVEVVRGTPVAKLGTSEIFGEMAFIAGGEARHASVESHTECLLTEFEPPSLDKMSLGAQLQLTRALVRNVSDRLALANTRLAR